MEVVKWIAVGVGLTMIGCGSSAGAEADLLGMQADSGESEAGGRAVDVEVGCGTCVSAGPLDAGPSHGDADAMVDAATVGVDAARDVGVVDPRSVRYAPRLSWNGDHYVDSKTGIECEFMLTTDGFKRCLPLMDVTGRTETVCYPGDIVVARPFATWVRFGNKAVFDTMIYAEPNPIVCGQMVGPWDARVCSRTPLPGWVCDQPGNDKMVMHLDQSHALGEFVAE